MHFSSLWFWALAKDLTPRLEGGRVSGGRVFQAGLVLTVEQAQAWDLIFWLDARFPRAECLPSRGAHRLPGRWQALQDAAVSHIVQPDSDRRLNLDLVRDEDRLVLEYYAFATPALVLKDAAGKPVAEAGAPAPRPNRPGRPFLLEVLNTGFRGDPGTLRGLDDLWLKAALSHPESPWSFIEAAGRQLVSGPITGYLVLDGQKPVGVSLADFSPQLPELTFEDCGSLSHASSRFVSAARRSQDLKDERTAILAAVTDLKSRLSKTLSELKRDRARQSRHPELKENADYLKSQLSHVRKGQAEITVPCAEGDRKVALDPRLKPHEQADRWYQEARRLKRGMETTQARLDQTREKLDHLSQLARQVEGKLESEEPELALAFAALEKLVQARTRTTVRVQQEPVRFRRFRSPGGLAIWVGRNNVENDELTLHAAHKEDLWFHAQQTPGSHVVLRSHAHKGPPARQDIVAAAATAAYYSRARTSKKVPVIFTLAKYVHKPRKAPAGTVTVEREKSLMVEPGLCPVWDADS